LFLEIEQFDHFINFFIELILTELEQFVEHIKDEFQKEKPNINLDERVAVVALCMKCADLSNEIRYIYLYFYQT
jgi:hypothetical protein